MARRADPSLTMDQEVATGPSMRGNTSTVGDEDRVDTASRIAFSVAVEPRVLRIDERSVITVTLVNGSDRSIDGVRIFSSGPWDDFAVEAVQPDGRYDYDLLGATFSVPIIVAPNQTGQVRIAARPISAGSFSFTFTPTPAPGTAPASHRQRKHRRRC